MLLQDLKKFKLPDQAGIYLFKRGGKILYIGKATSLKDRTRRYFAGDLGETRGPKIVRMLALADRVAWQATDSVLEALLLESVLIKKHQPPYNTREKDDKSYWFAVITDEPFPRVLLRRGRQLANDRLAPTIKIKQRFGPFPRATEIKAALKIIRRIFPYRDRCQPSAGRPCFNWQIGLCPGICVGAISQLEYRKIIAKIKLFFSGQKNRIISQLEREMKQAAQGQKFESAAKIRNQLFALKHLREVALLKTPIEESSIGGRIEAYDVAHLQGRAAVGAMVVWKNGELDQSQFKKFKLRATVAGDDLAGLREILTRRLNHPEWPWPDLIVVDGDERQANVARAILKEKALAGISVVGVVKGENHRARRLSALATLTSEEERAIVAANDAAHRFAIAYHRRLMRDRP